MATVRKSKKKKIIIAAVILAVIIAAGTAIAVAAIRNSIPEVSLHTVGTSDIYETVNSTGKVSSGAVKEYKVGAVATVKEVFVKVGDEVKKGDKLATFDTKGFDSEIAKLQSSYNQAKASYKESVEAQKTAKKNLAAVQKQIAALEKENVKLQESISNNINTASPSVPNVPSSIPNIPTMPTIPDISDIPDDDSSDDFDDDFDDPTYDFSDDTVTDETMKELVSAIENLTAAINTLSGNPEVNSQITNVVMNSISEELEKGNTSPESIAAVSGNAVREAVENGDINDDDLAVNGNDAAQAIQDAVGNINWNDVSSAVTNSGSAAFAANQLMLTAYYVQEQMYSSMASDSIVAAKKELMDTTKHALDLIKDAQYELQAGWTAAFDGTVTGCDIYAGEQTSLLSGGITIQNMNNKIITISLGEYDIHKVKIDMPVKVKTAFGGYTGKVISKAPVATGGNTSSLMDSVGSTMGISGLSSLTQAGAGVEVQISVDNPDEFIIIGFDADVEIAVGEHIGITTVPSQTMVLDKAGSYVFVYDEEEETVTKTLIETGASSVSNYEIISGVKVGDKIVLAPQSTMEDSFKARVKK